MHSTNRLLLIVVGASAWTHALNQADLRELLNSASDVWRVPSLVARWHDLQNEAAQLDQRLAAFQRICQARRELFVGLCRESGNSQIEPQKHGGRKGKQRRAE